MFLSRKYAGGRIDSVKTRVVHCKKEPYDVYIGRPSKWGNPFSIGPDGTRKEVIEKYRQFILEHPQLIEDIDELDGKVLGCWCSPRKCHGDVIVEILQQKKENMLLWEKV
jgi:hypothetical protein